MSGDKTLFYCVHISNRASRERGTSLCWSQPFEALGEASAHGKALVDAGNATMSVVVRFGPEGKRAISSTVRPRSARRIVEHWIEILDSLEEEQ